MELFLNDKLGKISYEIDEYPGSARGVLIISHGAGAGMHHPFLVQLAQMVSANGYHTIRFNFPYMEKGRKAPGSPKDAIIAWYTIAIEMQKKFTGLPVFISGKSYGGRMASHLLSEKELSFVNGIIYFGFPLHAPGRDSKDRASHLPQIRQPQFFIQGVKDKLANIGMIREVVKTLNMSNMVEIEDADHSFNVPKSTGISKDDMMMRLAKEATNWMKINT